MGNRQLSGSICRMAVCPYIRSQTKNFHPNAGSNGNFQLKNHFPIARFSLSSFVHFASAKRSENYYFFVNLGSIFTHSQATFLSMMGRRFTKDFALFVCFRGSKALIKMFYQIILIFIPACYPHEAQKSKLQLSSKLVLIMNCKKKACEKNIFQPYNHFGILVFGSFVIFWP